MKENFTPGPWSVFFTEFGLGNIAQRKFTVSGGGHSVAGCFCTNPDKNDENDANGYLIAAAPEMYDALSEAVELYGKPGGPWNVPSEPGSWIEKAKEALKKARGEE